MSYSKMATLVCPVSMCLAQGLYSELFLIGAFNRLQRWQRKRGFWLKPLLLKQMLYAFSRKKRCSRKYRVLTDTSPLVTDKPQYLDLPSPVVVVKMAPRALKIGVQSHFHPISTVGFRTFFLENFGLAYS